MSSGLRIATATSPELTETLGPREMKNPAGYYSSTKENTSTGSPRKFQRQNSHQMKHVQQFRNPKFTQGQKRRAASFSTFDGKFVPHKRRKKDECVQARNFLLGGSITDPLNLGSLADEEVNRSLNESTPKTSPLPTPRHKQFVEVLIPPNINDPLNLSAGSDAGDLELNLISPKMRKRKNKKVKKDNSWEENQDASMKSSEKDDAEVQKEEQGLEEFPKGSG